MSVIRGPSDSSSGTVGRSDGGPDPARGRWTAGSSTARSSSAGHDASSRTSSLASAIRRPRTPSSPLALNPTTALLASSASIHRPPLESLISPSPSTTSIAPAVASSIAPTTPKPLQNRYLSLQQHIYQGPGTPPRSDSPASPLARSPQLSASSSHSPSSSSSSSGLSLAHTHIPLVVSRRPGNDYDDGTAAPAFHPSTPIFPFDSRLKDEQKLEQTDDHIDVSPFKSQSAAVPFKVPAKASPPASAPASVSTKSAKLPSHSPSHSSALASPALLPAHVVETSESPVFPASPVDSTRPNLRLSMSRPAVDPRQPMSTPASPHVTGSMSPASSSSLSSAASSATPIAAASPRNMPSSYDEQTQALRQSLRDSASTQYPLPASKDFLHSAGSSGSSTANSACTTPAEDPNAVKETHHISIDYDPVSGRKKLNAYEIIRELGRGQHGKVKLGRQLESGEYVAIKIVDRTGRPRLGRALRPGSTQEDKIRREIAILKKCVHPNIVRLLEVLDDSNSRKIYLVLEYLERGEVEWQDEDHQPIMPRSFVKTTARDVLLGLEYLHFQGIIHRDIKPANLLLSRDGVVKISDFGVSYISSMDWSNDELELAKTAGTPAFFAPELCVTTEKGVPRPPITYKIDIWAFGVTLYCLIYGCVPFIADSEYELFGVIVDQPLVFPDDEAGDETHGSATPAKFDTDLEMAKDLIRKMLEKDPEKRIELDDIKRHPWVCEGLDAPKLDTFLRAGAGGKPIEVTGEEMQAAVQGITSKIKRGLSRFGNSALELAGIRRKSSSTSSVISMRSSTTGSRESVATVPIPTKTKPSSHPLKQSIKATEPNTFDRRPSYASTTSTTSTEIAAASTKPISMSQRDHNLNGTLSGETAPEPKLKFSTTPVLAPDYYPYADTAYPSDDDDDEEEEDDDDGELTLVLGPSHRRVPSDGSHLSVGAQSVRRSPSLHVPSGEAASTARARSKSIAVPVVSSDAK